MLFHLFTVLQNWHFSVIAWPLHMLPPLPRMSFLPLLTPLYPLDLSLVVTSFSCLFFSDLPSVGSELFFPPVLLCYSPYLLVHLPHCLCHHKHYNRGWQTYSINGQIVNILGFESHMVCVASIRLFYCIMKVTIDNTKINGPDCVQIQLYLQKKKRADLVNRPSFAAPALDF